MREILFRGKKANKDKWIYGVPVKGTADDESEMLIVQSVFNCEEYFCRGCNFDPVIPETVGQFTGLTDKNGKKIFEGDILRFDYAGKSKGVQGVEFVVFENGKFGILWGWHKEFVCLDGFANTTLEVIGNIHDNHELLEELQNG